MVTLRKFRRLRRRVTELEQRLALSHEPLWATSHRNGALDDWDEIAISGQGTAEPTTEQAHSGTHSTKLTITADGRTPQSGVRMSYQNRASGDWQNPDNIPAEAFYSAWILIPEPVRVDWWNLMQWKQGYNLGTSRTARVLYWIVLNSDVNGLLNPRLSTRVVDGEWRPPPFSQQIAFTDTAIPIGEWCHLESYYLWDTAGHGRIRTWLNGRELWDMHGLTTEMDWDWYSWNRKPSWNLYGNRHDPVSHSMFLDDVAISTTRVGGYVPSGGW